MTDVPTKLPTVSTEFFVGAHRIVLVVLHAIHAYWVLITMCSMREM